MTDVDFTKTGWPMAEVTDERQNHNPNAFQEMSLVLALCGSNDQGSDDCDVSLTNSVTPVSYVLWATLYYYTKY